MVGRPLDGHAGILLDQVFIRVNQCYQWFSFYEVIV